MRHISKRLLMIAALTAAALCAWPTDARKATSTAPQTASTFIRVPDELKPDGFDMQEKGGKIVGMALVKKDGSRMDLTQKPKPQRDTVCPAGTTMICYYSETTTYCFCHKPGGSGTTLNSVSTIPGVGGS